MKALGQISEDFCNVLATLLARWRSSQDWVRSQSIMTCTRGERIIRYSNSWDWIVIFVFVFGRYFQTKCYSYSYSDDFSKPNTIRIRIRMIFQNRIYSYSYSPDFPNPNSIRIRIRLKFENRIVCISPKVKIWNFLLCLLAQKTQYAIFTVLSFSICVRLKFENRIVCI